jgi:hypothetical protein
VLATAPTNKIRVLLLSEAQRRLNWVNSYLTQDSTPLPLRGLIEYEVLFDRRVRPHHDDGCGCRRRVLDNIPELGADRDRVIPPHRQLLGFEG